MDGSCRRHRVVDGFGAVLTFTAANLPGKSQEAFGGTLSLVAVVFVTAMVCWMRRSARTFSGEIKQKVTAALGMGAGILIATSFLAVGREGLETALFLWTTAQAAGSSSGPLAGAAVELLLAAALCWGLYRRVLHINLTRFFSITGAVLIVIAAGVLGYGMRDLQEATAVPAARRTPWICRRVSTPASWYVTVVQGTLNLTPQMTWLQVGVYGSYLAIVMTLFVRGVRGAAPAKPVPVAPGAAVAAEPTAGASTPPRARSPRCSPRRTSRGQPSACPCRSTPPRRSSPRRPPPRGPGVPPTPTPIRAPGVPSRRPPSRPSGPPRPLRPGVRPARFPPTPTRPPRRPRSRPARP